MTPPGQAICATKSEAFPFREQFRFQHSDMFNRQCSRAMFSHYCVCSYRCRMDQLSSEMKCRLPGNICAALTVFTAARRVAPPMKQGNLTQPADNGVVPEGCSSSSISAAFLDPAG